jgi:homoserine dehydrogenase
VHIVASPIPPSRPRLHAAVSPADIVQLRSARYCDNPLTVQGPGAGPQVTAAGVFADVLRVAEAHGARA